MKDVILLANPYSPAWGFAKRIQNWIIENEEEKVPLARLEMERFNNREILPHVPENIRKKDVFLIQSSNKHPNDWWVELILIRDMALSASVNSISFVLPNMLYTRQDRKHKSRVPISSRAFANSVSDGLKRIITMDLHSPQIQNAYPANVPIDNLYSFPEVVKYLKEKNISDLEHLAIVSPDAGGVDRAASFLGRLINATSDNFPSPENYSFAFTHKLRDKPGEVAKMWKIGNVKDNNILVIDDIYDTGSTNIECAKLLKKDGAKKLMSYATHGLFTKGTKKLLKTYDHVFTSNTHYANNKKDQGLEVIDMSGLFAEAIYRAQKGLSVSKMFD
jgi:ribose-phosphate pyrophosphokinase